MGSGVHTSRRNLGRRLSVLGLGGALVVLIAAGCRADDPPDQGSTATTTAPTTTATTTPTTAPAATVVVIPADPSGTTRFSSPTGNVGCALTPQYARCDIADADWPPPATDADCPLDIGDSITVTAGGVARFGCHGDTTLGAGLTLADGDAVEAGRLRCTTAGDAITCRDVEAGDGFELSRASYRLF